MILRSAHRRLAALREKMSRWPEVPVEADSFHAKKKRLELRLVELEAAFFPNSSEVEEQESIAGLLEPLAFFLIGLFKDRSEVEQLLLKLDFPIAACPSQVAARVRQRQQSWRAGLGVLGRDVRDMADARSDHRAILGCREEVQGLLEALQLFTDASRLDGRRRHRAGASRFEADLFSRRLIELPEGPQGLAESRELALELQRALELSRELDSQIATPFSSRLDDLVQGLTGWAGTHPEADSEIAQILVQKEAFERASERGEAGPEALTQLTTTAETRLRSFEQAAAEVRNELLKDLERRLAALSRVSPQEDLRALSIGLAERQVVTASDHQRWLEEWRQLDGPLKNRAHNLQDRLGAIFEQTLQAVEERFASLSGRPLGRDIAAAVVQLGEERKRLQAVAGVEPKLAAWIRLESMRDELDRLGQLSQEQARALQEKYAALAERARHLAELTQALAPQLALPGRAGGEEREPRDLDAAQAAYDLQHERLAVEENLFIRYCSERRETIERSSRRLVAALDKAAHLGLVALPESAPAKDPRSASSPVDGAADGLRAALVTSEAMRRLFVAARAAAQQRFAAAEGAIAELEAGRREISGRLIWQELRAERAGLAEPPADGSAGGPRAARSSIEEIPEEVLLAFERLVDHLGRFAEHLAWNESRRANFRSLSLELAGRLRELERRRWSELCPQLLLDRAYLLIEGLNLPGAAAAQLEAAGQLVEGLERHARQRAFLADRGGGG